MVSISAFSVWFGKLLTVGHREDGTCTLCNLVEVMNKCRAGQVAVSLDILCKHMPCTSILYKAIRNIQTFYCLTAIMPGYQNGLQQDATEFLNCFMYIVGNQRQTSPLEKCTKIMSGGCLLTTHHND
jgi:hypothetical protein